MKFVCPVCGYVEEIDGDELPADYKCPICKCPGAKFNKMDGELTWAAEHVVGIGKAEGVPEDIIADLR
ncbi:MAG: NADH peroxidase, partial [Coriobacteriales bacterium]|nr:NADH peroxidase [Coriobacteriales bacterium]